MEGLCSACLCVGRNLNYIEDSAAFSLYLQMLNEIPTNQPSQVHIRVCWECNAVLRRFQQFRVRVRQSFLALTQLQESSLQPSIAQPPRLEVHTVTCISIPYDDVVPKPEPGSESDKLEIEVAVEVKMEPEDGAGHCEETFANDFEVEPETADDTKAQTKEKTKKVKVKKQKSEKTVKKKVRKRKRKKTVSESIDDLDVGIDCDTGENGDLEGESVGGEDKEFEPEIEEQEEKEELSERVSGEEKEMVEEDKVCEQSPRPHGRAVSPHAAADSARPQCTECGKVFSSRKTYRYHLNVLHKGQNRYPCPRCGKVYQWKSNLGRHMRTHKARDAGELYCSPCDKKFASVATYRQHLKVSRRHVSESEFSFMCTECGKKFVNKTRLRDHVDWEHLHNIKFRCQLCNKPFKCHTSLYVHMQNVHRNKEKKDNLCHVCGKSYQNAAKLKYHIVAMHTPETPYRCAHCGAAFGWYSSLYRHVREVHYKMKVQPKKTKRPKRAELPMPAPVHPVMP